MNNQIKNIVFIAIMAAIMCVIAPVSFSIGIIPITLGTFSFCLVGGLLSYRKAFATVLIYILIGFIGIPVFSSYQSGVGVVLGVTGGYLVGYLPSVLVISIIVNKFKSKIYVYPLAMIIGILTCYLFGTIWFMFQSGNTFIHTLSICVIPFIIPDLIKVVVASFITYTLNNKTIIGKMLD